MEPEASSVSDDGQRRRLPASERRLVILDAALRTFASRGYEGAAMEEIAAAAGVSKAVVYDHVASKHELYTMLLESIREELIGVIEAALDHGGPSELRVRVAAEAFFRYVEGHREACRLLFLELQGANVAPVGRELEERINAGLAATLGTDPGVFRGHPHREQQLQMLAELVKSAVQGLGMWWLRHPDAAQEDLVERTVGVIWPAIERARVDARG